MSNCLSNFFRDRVKKKKKKDKYLRKKELHSFRKETTYSYDLGACSVQRVTTIIL